MLLGGQPAINTDRIVSQKNRYRLIRAVVISLALHICLLTLQPNKSGWTSNLRPSLSSLKVAGKPAPVTVTLASYRLRPAIVINQEPTAHIPATLSPKPVSNVTAVTGDDIGGFDKSADQIYRGNSLTLGLNINIYHEQTEVSRRAELLSEIDFDLPEVGNISGAGRFGLTMYINETGSVDRVVIDDSHDIDKALTSALSQQFSKGIFQPALIDGIAVKSRIKVEILVRPLMRP